MNLATAIRDVNPSRLVVFSSLLVFSIIFGLRLDSIIEWNYWVVFFPIWCWKLLAISGACVGFSVWIRHPNFRSEAAIQFKSMLIYGALNAVLMMFEILVCAKTDATLRILWVLVFLPLLILSVVSIGLCVWSARHEKPFEMELFFSANLLLFVFVPIKLDGFVSWSWAVVLIPLWIVMAVTIVAVLYGVILAAFLWRSPDVNPAQKRASLSVAVGYACAVVPLLVFEILLTGKLDDTAAATSSGSYASMSYSSIFAVLDLALCALVCTSFTARGSNQWWFGIRKEFGQFVLDTCPLLQEYGNVEYKFPESVVARNRRPPRRTARRSQRTGSLILTRGSGAMRFDLAALSGSDVDVATPSSVTFSDLHAFGFDEPISGHANASTTATNAHDSANASLSRSPPPNASLLADAGRDLESIDISQRPSRALPLRLAPATSVGRSQSLGVASASGSGPLRVSVARRTDRRAPLSVTTSANTRAALDSDAAPSQRVPTRTGRLRGLFHSAVATHAQREQLRQLERVQRELQRSGELRAILGLRPLAASGSQPDEELRPASSVIVTVNRPPSGADADVHVHVDATRPSRTATQGTSRNESVRSEGASRASSSQRRRSDDAVIELDAGDAETEYVGVNLTRTPSLRVASGSVASMPRSTLFSGSHPGSSCIDERRSNPSLTSRANTSRLRVGVCNTPVLLHVDVHSSNDLHTPVPAPPLADGDQSQQQHQQHEQLTLSTAQTPCEPPADDCPPQGTIVTQASCQPTSSRSDRRDARVDSRRSSEASQDDCPDQATSPLLPASNEICAPAPVIDTPPPATSARSAPSQNTASQLSVPPPTYAASQHSPAVVPLASSTPPPYSSSPTSRPPPAAAHVQVSSGPQAQPAVSSRFFASLSRHLRSHSRGSRTASKKQRLADERKNSMTQDWLVSNAPLARSIYTPD